MNMITYSVHPYTIDLDNEHYFNHYWYAQTDGQDMVKFLQKTVTNAWSHIVWDKGTRGSLQFNQSQLLVLDCDFGFPIAEVLSIFKDHWYIIGTTRNHLKVKKGIKCERYRVVLSFERPIFSLDDYYHNAGTFITKYNESIAFLYSQRIKRFCDANAENYRLGNPKDKKTIYERWHAADPCGKSGSMKWKPFTEIISINLDGFKISVEKAPPPPPKKDLPPEKENKFKLAKWKYFQDYLGIPANGNMYTTACEICQENGNDKNGDHLSVRYASESSQYLFKCNKDDNHSKELLRQKIFIK